MNFQLFTVNISLLSNIINSQPEGCLDLRFLKQKMKTIIYLLLIQFSCTRQTEILNSGGQIPKDTLGHNDNYPIELVYSPAILSDTQTLVFTRNCIIKDSAGYFVITPDTMPIIQKYYSIYINPTFEGQTGAAAYKIPDSTWVTNNYKNTILALLYANKGTFKSEGNDYKILLDSIRSYLDHK